MADNEKIGIGKPVKTLGFGWCTICKRETSQEEAIRRKASGEFPHVYWPAVIHEYTGQIGHVECFIRAGLLSEPDAFCELTEED